MTNPSDLQRACLDAWNRRDFDTMKNLLHSDYTYTGPDGRELKVPEAMKSHRMWATALPDGKVEIKWVVAQGDVSVCEFVASGTHNGELMGIAPTGKHVEIRVCKVMETRDNKIYRDRDYMDLLGLMIQIGAVQFPGNKAA
ncbi:MAG TPA: ester cyclase [Terriglobia bacterium]|nr:ester cyclase [Terriglobia bacterium]